ncbi:MAG: hypothetical protein LBH41_02310 [Rickettsiales bacterium]|jgi:hypothetical protein|nr:hypothetical protein [Rickettsiales bacterium]
MKTSLFTLAALAITTAASAGVTENPLYAPAAGKFYSVTGVEIGPKSRMDKSMYTGISEKFGYGVTDAFNVALDLGYDSYSSDFKNGGGVKNGLSGYGLNLAWRYAGGGFIGDLYGRYGSVLKNRATKLAGIGVGPTNSASSDLTIGTRFGVKKDAYTVSGKIEYDYSKAGDDKDGYYLFGVDGQYQFVPAFSANLGLEYIKANGDIDIGKRPLNYVVGLNWDINPENVATLYIRDNLRSDDGEKDTAYGVKYGVQF